MDGILVQNPHEIRQSLAAARAKTTTGPRKALANIQNTHQSKSVTFDGTAIKPVAKSSLLRGTQTPASKQIKKLSEKASTSKKGYVTPFKIFDDSQKESKKQVRVHSTTKTKKKIDIYQDEIEYMPPCTDKDVELKMPDYLHKVCSHKPIYNASMPGINVASDAELKRFNEKIRKETIEHTEKLLAEASKEQEPDSDLEEFIKESFQKLEIIIDDDLFAQMDSDESFSLEALDREMREAGLDPPDW